MTPDEAYCYAFDHGPSDKTRAVACRSAYHAYLYACYIDKCARDDTWEASKTYDQVNYLGNVPGAMKLYFKDWLIKNRDGWSTMKRLCNWNGPFTKHYNTINELDIDAAVVYVLSIRRGTK